MTLPAIQSRKEPRIDRTAEGGRYIRQELFRSIGREGQEKLRATHVALIGCGALGSAVADLLIRAGVGELTIVDRDYVELHNLQRQSLFTEADVASHMPKAETAANVLASINSEASIRPIVADFNGSNAEQIASDATILVDGTDNFETRYLINDLAAKTRKPWIYGGVIASHGTTMTIRPGETLCLRCLFPTPPAPGSTPTCDTAGVIGPAIHVIASIEVAEAMKLAVGDIDALNRHMLTIDLWNLTFDRVLVGSPRTDCPTCGARNFEFLDRARPSQATVLCGHDAIQVLPDLASDLDLEVLAQRLRPAGDVMANRFLLRYVDPVSQYQLTVFPDGRAIIKGTTDESEARSVYARFIGA